MALPPPKAAAEAGGGGGGATAASTDAPKAAGPLTSFIQRGGRFPILLMAHRRAEVLRKTLDSLAEVRDFSAERLFVAQDGDDRNVSAILKQRNLAREVHQQPPVGGQRWKVGATRIARHYKWSVNRAFRHFDKTAPGLIIIEDDLLFSPDFLEYLHAAAPLLDEDPSLWVVSAWNDNGFRSLVHEAKRLQRTEFMPGLGWLLPRSRWEGELELKWPDLNWDHWMRDRKQHRHREVVFPQVPRVFHNGIEGTFMEPKTHQRYFAAVATNKDAAATWLLPSLGGPALADEAVAEALSGRYEARLEELLRGSRYVWRAADLAEAASENDTRPLAVWLVADPDRMKEFEPIASFFGVWHEARRGAHRGLHELWFQGRRIFLVNIHPKLSSMGGISKDDRCLTAGCDPKGRFPCCSAAGWCGKSREHCQCLGCVDYRQAPSLMLPRGYGQLRPLDAPVLKAQDFRGIPPLPRPDLQPAGAAQR